MTSLAEMLDAGRRALKAHDTAAALAAADAVLRDWPDNVEAWLLRGAAHFQRREAEDGERANRRALELAERALMRALLQTALGEAALVRWNDVREHAERLIALDAEHPEAHFLLARAYLESGDEPAAREHLRHAIAHRPHLREEAARDPRLAELLAHIGDEGW